MTAEMKALNERAGDAALLMRRLPEPVAVTATTEPIVGLGTAALTSFWAFAVSERVANPTEGGLNLKTE